MVSNEFIDCGPRVVHEDDQGPYVIYRHDVVRSGALADYVGIKVHVTASLLGDGWTLSEWEEPKRWHRGGWWTRAGFEIAWVDATGTDRLRHL